MPGRSLGGAFFAEPEGWAGRRPRQPETCRPFFALRQALDSAYLRWDLPAEWVERARKWCHQVRIVVTGGFNPKKIALFERPQVPADVYGVGSSLLESCSACGTNTDFSADVVRVRLNGHWVDMTKVGRQACDNPDLRPVDWQAFNL